MPLPSPYRPKAKAITANDNRRQQSRPPQLRVREADAIDSIDWLALWALSIGLSALLMAGLAFFSANDPHGASCILAGAAAIIAAVLCFSRAPGNSK